MPTQNSYHVRKKQKNYWKNKKKWWQSPKGKYYQHRQNAYSRRVPWRFTFETWWKMWQDSGHWGERGSRPGQFCMARREDQGPYSPENCYITTNQANFWENRAMTAKIRRSDST